MQKSTQTDLALFNQEILGFRNSKHHLEWDGILDGSFWQHPSTGQIVGRPLGVLKDETINRWIMLEAPRSHAKSTTFTVNYPIWEIVRNRNIRIVIVSASQTQSEAFLREITTQIERNEKLKEVFGSLIPQFPEKWTQREIIVDRTATNLKDATISATSVGGTVLARRADIIICDDILNEGNTRTADQREKVREWFFQVLLPVLEPKGRLIVVGTPWNADDLYQQLLGSAKFNIRAIYDAIINEDEKKVLWPERWSHETLMDLKGIMGSLSFNLAYRCQVTSAEDAIFQQEWISDAKRKGMYRKLIPELDYASWDLGGMTISAGVDLAISQKDDSDYTAMAVIGRMEDGRKIPLYLSREKLSPAQTRANIKDLAERFPLDIIIVENNAYQEALRRDLADTTDLPIRGYTTGGEKFDKDIGINSLAVEFENGKWILPYYSGDWYTTKMIDYLTDGMMRFPSGHTEDLLMALWLANNGQRDLLYGKKTSGSISYGQASIYQENID